MRAACARRLALLLWGGVLLGCAWPGWAQTPAPAAAPASAPASPPATRLLFAVEIKTGPAWVSSKPPQDQAFFREHSAHLRQLREAGVLVLGARYADKGLLVMAADSAAAARAAMEQDPSIRAGTFVFELHEFSVFYGGQLQPPPRPPRAPTKP